MRLRKKKNLDIRMERCAHILVEQPPAFKGQWRDKMNYTDLSVELGCGKGLFTVETAKVEPNTLIVAIEKLAGAMIAALERTCVEDVQNVRYINAIADNITEYFAPGEVSRIYINFCDPWPANSHEKRRLTSRRFLSLYSQVLSQGAQVHFKTDNYALFDYSLREFEHCGYKLLDMTRNLHENGPVGIMTDYEKRFYAEGKPICRAVICT